MTPATYRSLDGVEGYPPPNIGTPERCFRSCAAWVRSGMLTWIGLVTTASTTFNDADNLARQFRTLDVMSFGRAGWNVVPTADDTAAANFCRASPARQEKYERCTRWSRSCRGCRAVGRKERGLRTPQPVVPLTHRRLTREPGRPARRFVGTAAHTAARVGPAGHLPDRWRRVRSGRRRTLCRRRHRASGFPSTSPRTVSTPSSMKSSQSSRTAGCSTTTTGEQPFMTTSARPISTGSPAPPVTDNRGIAHHATALPASKGRLGAARRMRSTITKPIARRRSLNYDGRR